MSFNAEKNSWDMMHPQFHVGKKKRPVGNLKEFEGCLEATAKPLPRALKKRYSAPPPPIEE